MIRRVQASLFIFILLFSPLPSAHAATSTAFDYSSWNVFLKKYVNERGEVDYQAIKKDPKQLDDFLASLSHVMDKPGFKQWPREETLAFWLNAYHAAMIKLVVQNYPVASVQKIPGFWEMTVFRIGPIKDRQLQFSLNDIRFKNLIGTYHDEKIHLALSMAAKSGPVLMPEAFTGPKVEGQLFLLTRKFVLDPAYVDVTPGKKKIRISRIFKWYGSDFKLDFGTPEPRGKFSTVENSVLSFLAYYLEDEAKDTYLQEADYKIEYLPFDWALNDWKRYQA